MHLKILLKLKIYKPDISKNFRSGKIMIKNIESIV